MSETGELPSGWTQAALEEVCEILAGFGFPSHLQGKKEGDYPFFKVGDISEAWKERRVYLSQAQHYLSVMEAESIRAKPLPPNTTVFAKIGAAIALNRRAILKNASLVDNNVMGLSPDVRVLDPKYLFYWACTLKLDQFSRATTVPSVRKSDIARILIPLPPLAEQVRIASEVEKQLTRLDAAILSLRHAKAKLARYRMAVLKDACEGRLVPTESELARVEGRGYEPVTLCLESKESGNDGEGEELGSDMPSLKDRREPLRLPEGWVRTSLGALCNHFTSGSRGWAAYYSSEGPLFLRVGNLSRSSITLDLSRIQHVTPPEGAEERRTRVQPGDILISITADIGMIALAPEGIGDAYINQHICIARPTQVVHAPYLAWYLASQHGGGHQLGALRRGATKMGLGLDDVRATLIALPPLNEQCRIVAEIERRFSLMAQVDLLVENSIYRASSLRRGILQQAFSGKLISIDPVAESSSSLLEQIRTYRTVLEDRESRVKTITNASPQRVTGIKPGVSTSGTGTSPPPPNPRRATGSVHKSAFAPTGLPDSSDGSSLGLEPQALRPGPAGAKDDREMVAVPLPSAEEMGEEETAFLDLSRDAQIDLVWERLLGRGALEKEEAIRTAAQVLREQGLAQFQRFRQGGPLYQAIAAALDRGIRDGSFDRPRRGHVRALLTDPKDYSPDEWRLCLLSSLDHEAVPEDDALRVAADWARENLGLEFARLREDGVILRGLRSALGEAIKKGEVIRKRGKILKGGQG